MANSIDLRKRNGVDNNVTESQITLVTEVRQTVVGANIFMSSLQALTILMQSDFLDDRHVRDFDSSEHIRQSDVTILRNNTIFELAVLVRTMAKGVISSNETLSILKITEAYGNKPNE